MKEKKIKILWSMAMVISLLLFGGAGIGYAAVTGICSNCHTMHNSQDGTAMAYDASGVKTATASAHLAVSSCIGCHATAVGAVVGPKIDGTYGTDSCAGGTFRAADADTDQKIHNVNVAIHALGTDSVFLGAGDIPGLSAGGLNGKGISTSPEDLTCAGANGCHGDATITGNDLGIGGFHHGSKEGYRFLQIASNQAAVSGKGSLDWEAAQPDATNHNVYSSSTTIGINKFCANCHPNFHSEANTKSGSDWIRHPTDATLPGTWAPNTTAADLYSQHPFAFADISGKAIGVAYDETDAQVMCLSCHRAHGSPYNDILRWDYADQCAGSATTDYGCLGCHSKQRG
ncbi:MAG: hypothetical protein MUO43_16290 [Desulfobacterales bacterium]|nr:hypothetical protein [Desulfobacterales bacterium]